MIDTEEEIYIEFCLNFKYLVYEHATLKNKYCYVFSIQVC